MTDGFDIGKFRAAKLTRREKDIPVPGLAAFFPDGSAPVWRIRGLTADELAKATRHLSQGADMAAILSAIAKDASVEAKVNELRDALNIGEATDPEVAKRIEHLVAGSISPIIETPDAVRLATSYPIEFFQLSNEILALTGLGSEVLGERSGSGRTPP